MPEIKVNPFGGDFPEGFNLTVIDRVTVFLNEMKDLPSKKGSVNLKLVSDTEIRELNKEFANIDAPTDVLSFPYSGHGEEMGDVAISVETAQRQAEAAGVSLTDELATLLVHGLLHILGLDHKTPKEQALMEQYQAKILKDAGLTYRKFKWQ